jgi:hypothetical protein
VFVYMCVYVSYKAWRANRRVRNRYRCEFTTGCNCVHVCTNVSMHARKTIWPFLLFSLWHVRLAWASLWHVGLAWASAQGIFVRAFCCCKATMGRSAQERTHTSPSRVPTAGPRTNREALSAASATHGVRAGTSYTRGRARLDGREIAGPRGVVQPATLDLPCSGVHRECRIARGRRGRRPADRDG